MKALLLAAGFGTRLKPLTEIIPKCLMPINGRPLLEYWIKALNDAGIKEVLVNLHYMNDKVESFLESLLYDIRVTTVFEPELLGTGGTILANQDFLKNEPFLLIHADNLSSLNIPEYIQAHNNRPKNTTITMMTFKTDTPETCGIVELNNENVVVKFHEKVKEPPGNHANGAVYICEPSIRDFLKEKRKSFIDFSTEVIPENLNKIFTFHNSIYHEDIGNIQALLTAQVNYPGPNINEESLSSKSALSTDDQELFIQGISEFFSTTPVYHKIDTLKKEAKRNIALILVIDKFDESVFQFILDNNINTKIVFVKEASAYYSAKDIFDRFHIKSFCLSVQA